MKRTLIICQFYPIPEVAGSCIRTMNFVRFFRKFGSVDIAYPHQLCRVQAGESIFDNEYRMGNTEYPRDFFGRVGAALKGRPYPIRSYDKKAKKLLSSLLQSNHYDYILIRYIVNTYNLLSLPIRLKRRIILDVDDLYSNSLYESLFYETKSLGKKLLRYLNRKLLLRYEKKCLDLNISIFCSEKDKINSIGGRKNGFVVPNTYSNETFENYDFRNGLENEKILLFVGMLAYEPNVQGLQWFIETIYPKFKQKHSDGRLCVVGHLWNSSDEQIRTLCGKGQDIELTTNAPDIKEFYKKSLAVVVPILTGGGTRIKILEAALAKRPVLATSVGCEGLDFINGRDLLIFNDADEFLLKFAEILNKDKYNAMTHNAKQLVVEKFSDTNFEASMKKVLNEIDNRM